MEPPRYPCVNCNGEAVGVKCPECGQEYNPMRGPGIYPVDYLPLHDAIAVGEWVAAERREGRDPTADLEPCGVKRG